PSRSAPAQQAAPATATPSSSEEVPLRSYTIDLGDGQRSSSAGASSTPPASGPAQPSTIVENTPQAATQDPQAGTAAGSSTGSTQTAAQGNPSSGTPQSNGPQPDTTPPTATPHQPNASSHQPAAEQPTPAPRATPTPTPAPRPSPTARAQAGESAQPPSRA